MYETVGRPSDSKSEQRKRAARSVEREPFNQGLYEALKATLNGTAIRLPIFTGVYASQALNGGATRNKDHSIDQGVRRRLQDKEGYQLRSEPFDAESIAVWIQPEVLFCSMTRGAINVPEYVVEGFGRLRRGQRSPLHVDGILVAYLP
jgi:hypothetical protein